MLDRLTGIEVFSRVAATGSFSAAGRALGLSQTMVTKHIAALEARLGTRVVNRSTRRIALTDEGRRYLEAGERILADMAAADAAIASDRIDPTGLLRVNAPVSFGADYLAPLLPAFAERYPRITVDLALSDRLVDLVEEGWDVAIRIGQLADSQLTVRRLAPCTTIVSASPSYLAKHGTPRRVAELSQHNCLGYTLSRPVGVERWAFGAKGDVEVSVRGNLRANNGDALRKAAIAGQGIIYQPVFIVADALRSGELVALELDHPPLTLGGIHGVYPPGRNPPAKVRAFLDFLIEALADPRWEISAPT